MPILDRNGLEFVVGARVVSYAAVERFPHVLFGPGVTGTVREVSEGMHGAPGGLVMVMVDPPWRCHELEEWDQCIECNAADGPDYPYVADEWVVTAPPLGKWTPAPIPKEPERSRSWKVTLSVFLRVEKTVDVVGAANASEAIDKARRAVGDWAEGCEVTDPAKTYLDVTLSEISTSHCVEVK